MRRLWPAVGLFAVLLAASLTAASMIGNRAHSVIAHLQRAADGVSGNVRWDDTQDAFVMAFDMWEQHHDIYSFMVNQSRVSDIAVQWRRTETVLRERSRDDFVVENAVLLSMMRQLVHDFEIAWYNVL